MKIRNGFVSNSSSSSYIVAYHVGEYCQHCGRGASHAFDSLRKDLDFEQTQLKADGFEEIMKKMAEWYDEEECKKIGTSLRKYAKANPNKKMIMLEISYHDESFGALFDTMVKKGEVEILKDYS